MHKIRFGPDGIHIFDRDTGTNLLLDEVQVEQDRWTKSPRQVSIALTNACELECTHCYAPKEPARLKLETLKGWILELDVAGCFGVGFGGGEPLLYPSFFELCEFVQQKTKMAVTLTTHGHRLNKTAVKRLKHSVNFMRVSMDGAEKTYEGIRGVPFSKLLDKLALLKGEMLFGINCVVNSSTINDLSLVAEIAEKYKAQELLLLPEVEYGRGKMIANSTLSQMIDWVANYKGSLQLAVSSSHAGLVGAELPLSKESDLIGFAHIDAQGVMKSCSFERKGVPIENDGVMRAFEKLIGDGYENLE